MTQFVVKTIGEKLFFNAGIYYVAADGGLKFYAGAEPSGERPIAIFAPGHWEYIREARADDK